MSAIIGIALFNLVVDILIAWFSYLYVINPIADYQRENPAPPNNEKEALKATQYSQAIFYISVIIGLLVFLTALALLLHNTSSDNYFVISILFLTSGTIIGLTSWFLSTSDERDIKDIVLFNFVVSIFLILGCIMFIYFFFFLNKSDDFIKSNTGLYSIYTMIILMYFSIGVMASFVALYLNQMENKAIWTYKATLDSPFRWVIAIACLAFLAMIINSTLLLVSNTRKKVNSLEQTNETETRILDNSDYQGKRIYTRQKSLIQDMSDWPDYIEKPFTNKQGKVDPNEVYVDVDVINDAKRGHIFNGNIIFDNNNNTETIIVVPLVFESEDKIYEVGLPKKFQYIKSNKTEAIAEAPIENYLGDEVFEATDTHTRKKIQIKPNRGFYDYFEEV
jgi:hypothetical protein